MIVAMVKTPLLLVSGDVVAAVVDTVVVAWRTARRRRPIVRPHDPPRGSRLDRDVAVAGWVVVVAEGDPVRSLLSRLFWEEEEVVVVAVAARPPQHVGSSWLHRTRRRIVMTTTMMAVVAEEED